MRMGVVAGGELAAVEVHHRVVHLFHLAAVQEPFALLRDDALYDALAGIEVVCYLVGVVLRAAVLELGTAVNGAVGVGEAVGVEHPRLEIHTDGVGHEVHILIVDAALLEKSGLAVVEQEHHRVLGFVGYDVGDGVGRDAKSLVILAFFRQSV